MATDHTEAKLLNQKSLRDLAILLIKDGKYHDGLFDISLEIQVAVGGVGPDPSQLLPGAAFGIKSIGLLRTGTKTPLTVDAAEVNPASRSLRSGSSPSRSKPK